MLPELVTRHLMTAALARLAPPDATVHLHGLKVTCTADGQALLVRDDQGHLLDRLAVPDLIRASADVELARARAESDLLALALTQVVQPHGALEAEGMRVSRSADGETFKLEHLNLPGVRLLLARGMEGGLDAEARAGEGPGPDVTDPPRG